MSAANHRENEAKFRVAPDSQPSLFSQEPALAGYTFQTAGTLLHRDTYLDTPAFDLLRHGLALRVRRNGSAYEVGIKSIHATRKGTIQDRMDVAFALPERATPMDAESWPAAVEEQLSPYSIKLDQLRPLLDVRQQRTKAQIRQADAERALAEWSMDEVWIDIDTSAEANGSVPDIATRIDQAEEDSPRTHFHELEIELLAPDEQDAFVALVEQVREGFDLSPNYTSKLVQGLDALLIQAHDNASELTPEMELEAAGRLLLHQQLFQVLLNEYGVRYTKVAKYVHDMRVAIRRALAAMQLCQQAFPAKILEHYEKGLRRLGRALGAVRDLDVALSNLRAFQSNQAKGMRKGIKLLRAELKNRRAHAHTSLLTLLDSKKHRKFIINFAAFCIAPATVKVNVDNHEVQSNQVRHTVPSIILSAFESARAYEIAFTDGAFPPPETFHALRIQAKYLRYLLEFTQHLLGDDGDALVSQLRDLQEHLGELNDAHVEQERLHQWATKLQDDNELCEAIETRLSEVSACIAELTTSAPSHLDAFIAYPTRVKLATALACI